VLTPDFTSIAGLLERRSWDRADHPFLIWAPHDGEARQWTYREFANDVARLAGGLVRRGVKPGDRVLVHLENCPEAALARFALNRIGAICVATNAMAAGPEIAHYAGSSRAIAAITQSKFAANVAQYGGDLRWIAVVDGDEGRSATANDSFRSLCLDEPSSVVATDAASPASIMFTTGTTSKPKGVVWTNANVLWGARFSAQIYGLRPDDVSIVSLPLFHVVGLCWSFLPVLWAGGTVVLQPKFSASRFWPTALEYKATIASQILFTTMALQNLEPPEHHFFRQWTVARGDSSSQRHNRIPAFVPSWGMTELMAPGIYGDPGIPPRELALGKASTAHEVRIVGPDGRNVGPGETGDLLIRGERGISIFLEYDQNPEATRAAFDEEGYFRTGDRVTLRDDGWIQFRDRASDIIKVGGEGVSPSEIETVVRAVPGVREVAVIAAKDSTYGEVPVAFVELGQTHDTNIKSAILDHCRRSLAKFKVPRRVIVLPELPRVGNSKISRPRLREYLENQSTELGRKQA
jgi:crotonobetaine/carnitine-CoA ligase